MSIAGFRRQARAWGRRQLYSLFSSLGTLMSHRVGTLMTVLVLGIAMALPLGLYVTVKNLRALDLQQEQWGTITVFLQSGHRGGTGPGTAGADRPAVRRKDRGYLTAIRAWSSFGKHPDLARRWICSRKIRCPGCCWLRRSRPKTRPWKQ